MQLNATCKRLCECLGVSEYEAKVYVSLVEAGTAKARTLSMRSGVPRTRVYDVLRKLMDMGLVVEIPEEPRKFAPTPPRTAFETYISSYQTMVENLLSVVSSLEHIFEEAKKKERPRQRTIWIINGRQQILRKIREMLSRAKHSVSLATNENGMVLLYKSFNRLFDELAERSVKVNIITSAGSSNRHMINELKYTCKVEQTHFQLPLILLCIDKEQLLVTNLEPDSFSLISEYDRGIFSDSPVLREMISLLIRRECAPHSFQTIPDETEEIARQ